MRNVALCIGSIAALAASTVAAQQPEKVVGSTRADSVTQALASLVRLSPSAFPALPRAVREELEMRSCRIPQPPANMRNTTKAGRKANLAVRANVVRGQFFERGKFAWAVICSAHGITSIMFIPEDVSRGSMIGAEMAPLSASPDASWIAGDGEGHWTVQPTILLAKASGINRTRDGVKLDRAEKARPVHDGLMVADTLDGSGWTIYWTGRRWIQVSSYD
jgi:hypothetical protein